MNHLQSDYPVSDLARTLDVTSAGFYAHQRKPERLRRQEDARLATEIQPIFVDSRKTYGSPRICAALRQKGQRHGRNRIARIMRQNQWRARQKRRYRPQTTQSDHDQPIAPNWLKRIPAAAGPNQIWVADITFIETDEGWVFLAVILDAFSRKVVGWHMAQSLESPLVQEALRRAVQKRGSLRGLLHHSDRGVQYASSSTRALLATYQITPSMSRVAHPYDNALAESFFATLKTECFGVAQPATRAQAQLMVFDYIETFYNPKRLHSALDYKSPVDFENQTH